MRENTLTEFDPRKLKVCYDDNCDDDGPIKGRKYSLSHSDETGFLFLTVGKRFYYPDNQTVLAELRRINCIDVLDVYVQLDNEKEIESTKIRDKIFRRELPLALKAIIYGDKQFFINNKLLDAFIRIRFQSNHKQFNTVEQWGKVGNICYR